MHKKKWRKWLLLAACMMLTLALTACGKSSSQSSTGDKITTFKHAEKVARGKTVTFYGFGGDEQANKWVDQVVAPAMKKKYDIKVKRVPMLFGLTVKTSTPRKRRVCSTGHLPTRSRVLRT